jgi:hypothetical protein
VLQVLQSQQSRWKVIQVWALPVKENNQVETLVAREPVVCAIVEQDWLAELPASRRLRTW